MTTPTASAPSQPSTAQAVLDQATSLHADAPAPTPEVEAAEVELEVEAEGKPERRGLSWADALKQVPPDIRQLMKSMHGKGYRAGGKTNMEMKKLGRGLAKVANQKAPVRMVRKVGI